MPTRLKVLRPQSAFSPVIRRLSVGATVPVNDADAVALVNDGVCVRYVEGLDDNVVNWVDVAGGDAAVAALIAASGGGGGGPVALLSGLYDHWPLATNIVSSLGVIPMTSSEDEPGTDPVVFEDGGMVLDGSNWLFSTTHLPLETGFTVSAWVAATPSNNSPAVSQWKYGKGGFSMGVHSTPTNRDLFAISNGTGLGVVGAYAAGYYMLTGAYDPALNKTTFYKNNTLRGSVVTSAMSLDNSAVLQIGTIDGGGEFTYQGLVNNVAIWNRPFTQAQVTALYNGGTPLPFASYATTIA